MRLGNRPLILLIDDEAHILHVVKLKLVGAGYEVITAEDGQEGLDMALEHRPDLVITDFQMPFLSGLELCIRLKQHRATERTPALMLTARGFRIGDESMDQTNIVGVISKPFSPREILSQVRQLVDDPLAQEAIERS